MNDIRFNIATREIDFTPDGSDFAVTSNPSVQNGGILLYSLGAFPLTPMLGVGLVPQVINGARRDFIYCLNRWQQQGYQDGATLAKWTIQDLPQHEEALINEVSYE